CHFCTFNIQWTEKTRLGILLAIRIGVHLYIVSQTVIIALCLMFSNNVYCRLSGIIHFHGPQQQHTVEGKIILSNAAKGNFILTPTYTTRDAVHIQY
ncbi:hypothetical protein ACJX0J_030600, partial [Zea mays]